MAGICSLCNNLKGVTYLIDDKDFNGCFCSKGKYDVDLIPEGKVKGLYSLSNIVIKPCKAIKQIQDKCDSWDDRLKAKVES